MPERADTLEVIGLITFAPLLYSMFPTPRLSADPPRSSFCTGRGGGKQGQTKSPARLAGLEQILILQALSLAMTQERGAGNQAQTEQGERGRFRNGSDADIGKIHRTTAIAILNESQSEIGF